MVSLAAFTVTVLTGMMAPYREFSSPPLGYQTIETRAAKKLEFPKNIILGRRKKTESWCKPEWDLIFGKEISHLSHSFNDCHAR